MKTIELDNAKLSTAMKDGAAIRDLLKEHCGNCTGGRLRGALIDYVTTIRKEEKEAAFKEAVRVVTEKADELRQTEPFGTGVISASVQILEALELAAANRERTSDD